MKLNSNSIRNRVPDAFESGSNDSFAHRLHGLSAIAGMPHWQLGLQYDPNAVHRYTERGRLLQSKAIVGAARKVYQAASGGIRSALQWVIKRRRMQHAVRELSSLNERALRDIGVTQGDIASIASGAVTVQQINQRRHALAAPRVRLVKATESPRAKAAGAQKPITETLLDHAA